MLRVDINLLFTVINLLFLVFLMKKFLFKPVRAILEKRQSEIEASFKNADTVNQEAAALKEKYEASLSNIETERQETINQAKIDASKEYDEIIHNSSRWPCSSRRQPIRSRPLMTVQRTTASCLISS